MCTAYLNNAERHSGRHLRSIINVIFNTKELLRTVRSVDATAVDKQLARAYLADIGSFKDIISNANSFNDVQCRLPELEELGLEFLEGFHLLSHILEQISNGVYHQNSLWYELTAAKSMDTLYHIACLNSQIPILFGRPGIKFQPFPLRHSFIPSYVPFDLKVVVFQILNLPTATLHQCYQNTQNFWSQHFKTNMRPFHTSVGGKEFDGMFWTDGYGVSILKRTPGTKVRAGQKRKHGERRNDKDS